MSYVIECPVVILFLFRLTRELRMMYLLLTTIILIFNEACIICYTEWCWW